MSTYLCPIALKGNIMAVSPYAQYQQNDITTAGPDKLLLITYDAAIRFARIGREKMKLDSPVEKSRNIGKSRALIAELLSTLDPAPNPELAASLARLYGYMHNRLVEADLNSDQGAVSEVIDMLTNLRGAWARAAEIWRARSAEGRLAA